MNFNGQSEPSASFTFNACLVPSGMLQPFRIDEGSTTNSLIIGWYQPEDNGGCPITGYSIYRDDALGGDVTTEVNTVDDPALTGNPVLRQATITSFEADSAGMTYRVMVRVHNREGYYDSSYFRIMNSGYPLAITYQIILLEKNETSI